MTDLKLSYFDMHAGRGEVARLALSIGGIPFEDVRISFPEWPAAKAEMPFRVVPVLEIDGAKLSQSNSINRYVGKLSGLYPDDALQAAWCDEAMDAVEDVAVRMIATFGMDEQAKRAARTELAEGMIPLYLKRLAAQLEARGGEWFAGPAISVADFKVFLWVRTLRSGLLDHVPTDLPEKHAPSLVAHFDRVNAHPGVRAYYDPLGVS